MTALLRPPDWTLFADCADHDPRLWDGQGTPQARAICAECPVRYTCALDALQDAIPDTMRGGLTPDERATIADAYGYDRPGTAAHGRRSRYVAGCHCLACTRANADWAQARRAAGAWTGRGGGGIPATGTRRISA